MASKPCLQFHTSNIMFALILIRNKEGYICSAAVFFFFFVFFSPYARIVVVQMRCKNAREQNKAVSYNPSNTCAADCINV